MTEKKKKINDRIDYSFMFLNIFLNILIKPHNRIISLTAAIIIPFISAYMFFHVSEFIKTKINFTGYYNPVTVFTVIFNIFMVYLISENIFMQEKSLWDGIIIIIKTVLSASFIAFA